MTKQQILDEIERRAARRAELEKEKLENWTDEQLQEELEKFDRAGMNK